MVYSVYTIDTIEGVWGNEEARHEDWQLTQCTTGEA